MSDQKQPGVLLLYNPKSGTGRPEGFKEQLLNAISERGDLKEVFVLEGSDAERKLKTSVQGAKPDLLIAAGGDGTVTLAAKALMEYEDCALGILPLGSANGLAYELGIPEDWRAAVDVCLNGKTERIDVVVFNEAHYCLHIADFGMNARIVRRFEQEKMRGMIGYFRQFIREIFASKPERYAVEANGKTVRRKAHMVAFANATKYGTGAVINPGGSIKDGLVEICMIKRYPWWGVFAITWDFFRGSLRSSRFVKFISCKEARVVNYSGQPLQIDGEVFGEFGEVTLKVLHQALPVRIAQNARLD